MPADLLTTIRAEIAARLSELEPLLLEYEELLSAGDSLHMRDSRQNRRKRSVGATRGRPRDRSPRGGAAKAIVAALEHGSHTVRELVVVTAMADGNIRANIQRMLRDGSIVKINRQGKTAYALPPAARV
jgi:hypothetical protein